MKEANFKETEIGKIPVDWEVDKVKDFASIKTGSRNTQDKIDQGKYPFFVRSQTVEKINSYCFDGEAVLTAGDGVGVGKVIHYINGKFDCHQRVYMMTNFNSKILPYYFYVYFNNNFLSRMMQMTAKSSVDSVRMDMISEMQIPLPPLAEQEKIAELLSDTDLWIESTEALLAKKRQIKKGAMQKLLSPKEDWEVRKLGEVCVFQNGLGHEQFESEFGKYIVVNSKFISTESRVKRFSHKNLVPLQKYDIVIVMSDIPNGKALAKCFYIDKDNLYTLNQRIGRISINDDFDSKFLFYLLNRNKHFLAFDGGSGQTNLRKQEVLDCPIHFPPLKTQQEIAEILSSMDLEIESLENRLQKARQLKQGMMQDLLTGKVRLIEN